MLQNNPFYWGSIRKVVVAFGSVFSDIHIVRTDSSGTAITTIKVPCEYGPKEKWLVRNKQNPMPGVDDQVEMVLPRMSYEITGFLYDSNRKLTSTGRTVKALMNDNSTVTAQYNPVPYNLSFQLNVMTKTVEDGLMIIEQILPFFTPDYTVSINDIPSLGLVKDVPIVLTGVQHEDTWEGSLNERRTVTWTLDFTVKAYLYPPTKVQKVNTSTTTNLLVEGDVVPIETITITPNPLDAQPDSVYTYTETVTSPVRLLITPSAATITSSQTKTFLVTIINTNNTAFTAALTGVGSLTHTSTSVVYTAPVVSVATTVVMRVTSAADPNQFSDVSITVNP